jgi:hypothetical protein
MRTFSLIITFLFFVVLAKGQESTVKLGLLKYGGGGDWYANPTSLPNLATFCNQNLNMNFSKQIETVEPGSKEVFNFPFLHMTGHGNVVFSDNDAQNLRTYLISGGFLHIDDNYGMDPFVRPALKKVFPELNLVELPFDHPIYKQTYTFKNGLPKVHEHDNKPPQGFGLIYEGRLVVFYSYETDLGNGWEDQRVHGNPEDVRQKALQMGANIIEYVFTN